MSILESIKSKSTLLNLRMILVLSISLLLVFSSSCDFVEEQNSEGIVNFIIVIESDMDSLIVSFYEPFKAEYMEKTLTQFPWSYMYTDFISNSTPWHIKGSCDSGYLKIIFWSSEVEHNNKFVLRDSVRYYSPFNDFAIQWASEEKVNYSYKMAGQADSVRVQLGYDAIWSGYRIDTLITNHYWSFSEFASQYGQYKGKVINQTLEDDCKFEFVSSGKAGRIYKSFQIHDTDTVNFKIAHGALEIVE
ncbi:MAG: hypothetical protein WC209_15015 [Ignavibacteriaceae bacterium]|jgi:hypothetical protein